MNEPIATARQRKPRYVIRAPSGVAIYQSDNRWAAWWAWFHHRQGGATAHDRLMWIKDKKSWLRCGDLPREERID
jgi:hypothetical protein